MARNDLPLEMTWEVGDNVLTARRYDPYGFWRFSFKRGQLPAMLQGDFSAESKVELAVAQYFASKKAPA